MKSRVKPRKDKAESKKGAGSVKKDALESSKTPSDEVPVDAAHAADFLYDHQGLPT